MSNQKFLVQLILKTECVELVTPEFVRHWVAEHFEGCDLGKLTVSNIFELPATAAAGMIPFNAVQIGQRIDFGIGIIYERVSDEGKTNYATGVPRTLKVVSVTSPEFEYLIGSDAYCKLDNERLVTITQ